MAANPINIVNTLRAVQYDGTNSSDITALDPGFDFNNASESSGVWSFQSPPDSSSFTINTGDWIVFAQNQVFSKHSNSEFMSLFQCNTTCDTLTAALEEITETVDGLAATQSMGVAPVPALILSASANVDVTLNPAMPDTSYTAYAFKFAGISIVDLQINSVTIIDEDTVRVNVSNVGLVTLTGANILVHAVA